MSKRSTGTLLENVKTIVYAGLIAIGIRTVAFEPFNIPSSSMVPTLLIGDFLSDLEQIGNTIRSMASRGARGHVLMIADPVEETFPFAGHTEFLDVDSGQVMRIGQAERFRDDYIRRLEAHRAAIAGMARAKGWSLAIHRTDRPASEALLALRMQLEAGDGAFSAGAA